MTKEQINIAIAEAQGWKKNMGDWYRPNANCQYITRSKSDGGYTIYPPNYCNDLNAMHEAENQITANLEDTYEFWLRELTKTSALAIRRSFIGECFDLAHATALQRAEAYLKTIGKWNDE